ncbi:PorP/SprF family type IX secretion system membrane protein [Rubrolithibacter danxiaensis]|uniref:PorP/SprF family type IX secretion system membrane protein n=1 Tax=Rubrolithibacter danxiaensis TaxID=3390805 RepID=UPI003BF8C26C
MTKRNAPQLLKLHFAVRLFISLVVLQFISLSVFAQQKAMFTQYMFNGLAINPAYSAVDEAFSVTALTRHQWVGFKGAPNTQNLSIHSPIKESNTSVGFMVMRDQIGEVIKENSAFITLAQRVEISEDTYLAVGLDAGISKYVAAYSEVSGSNSAEDPVFEDENDLRSNFGFGVMLFSDKFYAGFSSPYFYYRDLGDFSNNSSTAYRPHYILQGGYLMNLGEDFKLKPNVLVKYVNGSPMQIDLNANLLIKETIWLGASWRSFDSMDFLAQIQLTPKLQLGYSYDFTTSALSQVQKGSHEVMLNLRLPIKGRNFPRCYF